MLHVLVPELQIYLSCPQSKPLGIGKNDLCLYQMLHLISKSLSLQHLLGTCAFSCINARIDTQAAVAQL